MGLVEEPLSRRLNKAPEEKLDIWQRAR